MMAQAGASPPKRPPELEDSLNAVVYHPLAWRLAKALAPTPITPNMVSIAGAGLVVGAGLAYASPTIAGLGWPVPALAGLALHMGWHVIDGADGDLARLTGRASPFGEMIDGICDYASHLVLYVILAFVLMGQIGWLAWPVMLAGGLSHVAQATHVETHRRSYLWWVYGIPWLRQTRAHATAATRRGPGAALLSLYLHVGAKMTGAVPLLDAALAKAEPAQRERLRAAARGGCRPLLPLLMWLGPNPRALVLGAAMLIGRSPLWFFLWQAIGLNALLWLSMRWHDAAIHRILALAPPPLNSRD